MPEEILTPEEVNKVIAFIDCVLHDMEFNPENGMYTTEHEKTCLALRFPIEVYHEYESIVKKLKS
jgi:hypothetical protein